MADSSFRISVLRLEGGRRVLVGLNIRGNFGMVMRVNAYGHAVAITPTG